MHAPEGGAVVNENAPKEDDDLKNIPELEMRCSSCKGRGRIGRPGYRENCVLCDGSGYELTEFGKRVLSLIQHRFRKLFREQIPDE
jgi:Tryptophan RNA-binding attenuator protein inhibitory protein